VLNADLRGFGDLKIAEHIVLHHDDVKAINTEANPDNVAPTAGNGGTIDGGQLEVKLPSLSWNVIRLVKA
jgi:alpha-N-arabinofuranosidase